jgi:hypothetical protein
MAEYKFIPVPAEDFDALGININTVIQTYITEDGALVIRPVKEEDMEEFICDGDCSECPVSRTDCDGDCFSCPCYANCEDSEYLKEGACKSHGDRRANTPNENTNNEGSDN